LNERRADPMGCRVMKWVPQALTKIFRGGFPENSGL
jgi:hypothetical protein